MAKNLNNRNIILIVLILAGAFLLINSNNTHNFAAKVISSPTPIGSLQTASCNAFTGWACDPTNYGASVYVYFYLKSNTQLTQVGKVLANQYNSYSIAQCRTASHGFTWTLPLSLKDGTSKTIYTRVATTSGIPSTYLPSKIITCAAPASCTDNLKNQDETAIDCGGTKCSKCSNGKTCIKNLDCTTNYCSSGVCANQPTATCTDGIKNGAETDIDCGGSTCTKCAQSKTCVANSDCQSGNCWGNACQAPKINSCTDSDGGSGGPVMTIAGNQSIVWSNGTIKNYFESCTNSTNLIEYYCGWMGYALNVNCATNYTSCSNGACV